jgi:hypothetical protein
MKVLEAFPSSLILAYVNKPTMLVAVELQQYQHSCEQNG